MNKRFYRYELISRVGESYYNLQRNEKLNCFHLPYNCPRLPNKEFITKIKIAAIIVCAVFVGISGLGLPAFAQTKINVQSPANSAVTKTTNLKTKWRLDETGAKVYKLYVIRLSKNTPVVFQVNPEDQVVKIRQVGLRK